MSGLDLSRLRILVVDDNALARDMMKFALHALKVETIQSAENGAEALELIGAFEPDLILVDWMMEPIDGLDFVKRLRGDAANPYRLVPVIMITAFAEAWRVKAARDSGANEFIVKPFSARTLYAKIRAIVENPRPYVDDAAFFGPDRRRRAKDVIENRRNAAASQEQTNDGGPMNLALAS